MPPRPFCAAGTPAGSARRRLFPGRIAPWASRKVFPPIRNTDGCRVNGQVTRSEKSTQAGVLPEPKSACL